MKAEVLLLAAFGALTLPAAWKPSADGANEMPASAARIGLAQTRLFSGYDGKWCKVQPSVASDGEGTALLTYQMLDLGGSDVFSGQYLSKSTDGGETWSQPVKISESADVHERGLRVARYVNVYYLARSRRWTAMGSATMYGADARPYQKYAEGRPYCYPVQADVDAESGRIANYRPMPFPFAYELAMRFGQVVECENGEVLMPFYYRPVGAGRKGRAVVVRYRAGKDGWEIVRAGTPVVEDSLARGVGEPSVVKFRGRHYMTLRSDEYGMYAESEDGLNYSKPVKWVWADGQPIGNANTQQHWVPVGDRLYLAYTRVTPTNGHVFRNRAPIFMSEFDPARRCLLRETEREVVPERGARLGNFVVAPGRTGESWLVTAEWMQPKGCESHGSDNSLWLVKIGEAIRPSIVRDGRSDWTIVHGSAERDRLAATELQEIFEKGTGIRLPLQTFQTSQTSQTSRTFLIGAEFAGKELADEQTWVTAKDGNVVLAGGGVAGTCYAVYDFCEKYFGYRLYGMQPGAEIVKKVKDLAWDGTDISTRPAFAGYRISHNIPKARNEAEARFFRRNRNNAGDRPVTDRILGAQHGLFLWVPSTEKGYGSTWLDKLIGTTWEPMFEKHPEYFSLDRQGRRTNRGQLCFANKDVRKLLISRFREFTAKKGPGVYMVGSNDSHNERYCWCDGCAKMMEKYRTNGGPLWDFILELCGAVKDMKDVYVASLVYKGPEQTELAPTGVVFPENFVADLGFLNADRPPSRMRDMVRQDKLG